MSRSEAESLINEPQVKSGFIFKLHLEPGGCGQFKATSVSGSTEIELWVNPRNDVAEIKVRYVGEHELLTRVPEADFYPYKGTYHLLEAIEGYLQSNSDIGSDNGLSLQNAGT